MKSSAIEKRIVKIDHVIAAMNVAKKYLSNHEEIQNVILELNRERQLLVNDLYRDDLIAYENIREELEDIVGFELDAEGQKDLLEKIKEAFGRQAATDGKTSTGLNAWLKKLNVEDTWQNNDDSDWATLVVTGLGIFKK